MNKRKNIKGQKSNKIKTKKTAFVNKEIEKQPLPFTLVSFTPYDGTVVNKLELDDLKALVTLNDLRLLFKKSLPDICLFLEDEHLGNLEDFAATCPDHYKNIFGNEHSSLNFELVKKNYPEYYQFIVSFTANIITVEEFKEKYLQVLWKLRRKIGDLIHVRKIINIYNSNERNESVRRIVENLIAKAEIKTNISKAVKNIEGENTKSDIAQNKGKIKEEGKKRIIKITKENMEKFIWLKTPLALETLFEYLLDNYYINDNYSEILYQHFELLENPSDKLSQVNNNEKDKFVKINWIKPLTELAYFIYYLDKEGIIKITDDKCVKVPMQHFNWYGKDINNYHSFKQTRNNILYPKKGERDKFKYIPLINIIKEIKDL